MAAPPLLTLQDIHLTFGGDPVLQGAEMMVLPEETVCLVGRNGSGKSTLLKIAAGLIECEEGTRFVRPGTTVRYLPQEPDLSGYADTLSYVQEGLEDGDDPYRAAYLLDQLGLTGEEDPAHLSGGESRRAALARILAPRPDVLLLDEPTNHLDLPTIEWLEKELKSLRRALVLISHDRRFLEKLSRATVWLDRGQTRRLGKGFAHFEAWRDNIIDQEDRTQQKLDRKIVREEHWLRYGVSGRRKRNVRRLDALHTLRQDKHDHRKRVGNVSLQAG
ncbi:MAG: ABC-F family ATP-binding cassette domain-containing protein, partial [Rhodospirillaceae bacterium]|nr:ABC-F family ATP-binding cassette domain-containing protein [Rhodospirillaceae bacterium]